MDRSPRRLAPAPALTLASTRKIPPLPHPSWSRAQDVRAAPDRAIAADEFWKRLGL